MFDLNQAIKQWRKGLKRNESLEDGYIMELESHLRDEIEHQREQGLNPEKAFRTAVKKIGESNDLGAEYYKTDTRSLSGRPPWQPPRFMPSLLWNYLKISIRKLKRHKGYSLINITGLAAGIACSLFILMYVRYELSFDRFHRDVDRIYFVGQDRTSENGHSITTGNLPLMAPTIKERFPQVEAAGRYNEGWISQVRYQDRIFKEEALWDADPGIFEILSIRFIQGDPQTALTRPNTAVITDRMSEKYFGEENPLGKNIKIGDTEFEITGLIQSPPPNTIFKYKIIKSWKTIETEEHWQGWNASMAATMCLIKLRPGVDADDFEKQIRPLIIEYCGEELGKMGAVFHNYLLNIMDRHLVSLSGGKIGPSSSLIYVYIFSAVGGLILLIACMNYMNLATARSASRSAEVGMRKVVGARKGQIIRQFLGESLLMAFIAAVLAAVLVQILIPWFNKLAQTQFTSQSLFQPEVIIGLVVLLLVVGLAAGSYPAFVLSAFKPVSVIKGSHRSSARGIVMRRVMVVGQFTISIALVIATLIIYRQVTYMKSQPLGFDKDQKLVIMLKGWEMITEKYESVKNEFLQHPSVVNATATSGVPGSMINRTYVFPKGEQETRGHAFRSLRCDHDFIKVYGIELIAGRYFNKEIQSDTYQVFILNEAGIKAFGWDSPEEALGKLLWDRGYPIIGVVKDFHWWGLQRDIEPMIMRVVPDLFRSITLTVNTSNLQGTLKFLEGKYAEFFPGDLFEYFFVDTNFNIQYQAEERIGRIFQIFTFLGIFIACLGLFGLASFIAEQRTKEIGIRKVMGSSVFGIVYLLSKEFTKWVLVANVIAWPIAYYAARMWLENFAYRANIAFELFFLSAILALLIALLTVGYQAIRAATANPVDALRYE